MSQDDASLELAKLNRHWYRRRLDALDKVLREAPANPSILSSVHTSPAAYTGAPGPLTSRNRPSSFDSRKKPGLLASTVTRSKYERQSGRPGPSSR